MCQWSDVRCVLYEKQAECSQQEYWRADEKQISIKQIQWLNDGPRIGQWHRHYLIDTNSSKYPDLLNNSFIHQSLSSWHGITECTDDSPYTVRSFTETHVHIDIQTQTYRQIDMTSLAQWDLHSYKCLLQPKKEHIMENSKGLGIC